MNAPLFRPITGSLPIKAERFQLPNEIYASRRLRLCRLPSGIMSEPDQVWLAGNCAETLRAALWQLLPTHVPGNERTPAAQMAYLTGFLGSTLNAIEQQEREALPIDLSTVYHSQYPVALIGMDLLIRTGALIPPGLQLIACVWASFTEKCPANPHWSWRSGNAISDFYFNATNWAKTFDPTSAITV